MVTKTYIGSGKSTKFNGVTVTLRMEDAQKFAYETERGTYLTFVVSPRKEVDQFGKTHSCFVLVDSQEGTPEMQEMTAPATVEEPAPAAPKAKGKGKKAKA